MKLIQSLKNLITPKTKVIRTYAAAKNSPTMNIQTYSSGTMNDELQSSWKEVTDRTLALVRDFPLFSGAVANAEAFVVSDGIRPQMVVPQGASETLKSQLQSIEEAFHVWANDRNMCDFEGRMNFWEMQALTERQEGEFGEFIAVDQMTKGSYKVQMVEPLQLQDFGFRDSRRGSASTVIWRGIEYNERNRRPVAYHFTDPADANSYFRTEGIRIPADRVHHGFKMQRAGQMRGITPFTSAILLAYNLRDYIGSEVTAQNLSSRWMAFVTSPPSGFHTDHSNPDNVEYDETYDKYVKGLEYATIEYLKNGENVVMNTQTRSANGLQTFNEIITRLIASSYQMPYELISQDYSGLNFTTLRAVRNDFTKQLKPKWQRKASQFCQPIFEKWLRFAVLSGQLNLPDYFTNPQKYTNVKWITPTMEQIDPLKEFQADLLKMRSGVKPPQQVIKEAGNDPEKVIEAYKMWQDMSAELDFPELTNQTPVISNFEVQEVEEPEMPEPTVAGSDKEKEDRQFGRDGEGNLYERVDGQWKILEQ